jgi:hypothetical protein
MNLVGARGIATFCRSAHEIRKSPVAFCNRHQHQRARAVAAGVGGSNKKHKGDGAGGQAGQQSAQPKCAAKDNPDVEIHAGFYPPKVYRSLSEKQQRAVEALRKEKKKNKKDGSNIGAVVVAKPPAATEPSDGVAADKRGESPDESPVVVDPVTVADDSGAPADDEDSVIAVEDTKPAAISFGRAAFSKKPAPEQAQLVAAVMVTAEPVANSKPEPRGPMKGWSRFLEGDKHWSLRTQEERDEAIFKWADYSHWRDHEKDGDEGHYCTLSFGMVQSRYSDHSAGCSALPVAKMTNKEANAFLTARPTHISPQGAGLSQASLMVRAGFCNFSAV